MNNNWTKIHEINLNNKISVENFWSGIRVWIDRPHIVNRKLLATELLQKWNICRLKKFNDTDINTKTLEFFVEGEFSTESINKFLTDQNADFSTVKEDSNEKENVIDESALILILRKLLPRNLDQFQDVLEVIVLDQLQESATFFPRKPDVQVSAITPAFPYKIQLCDRKISLETYKDARDISVTDQLSEKWLNTSVLPKVVNWSQNLPRATVLSSLSQVSAKQYNLNYHYLKTKYGKKFVEIWPESSDPLKYVYEDISIASYLMTLWEKEREALSLTEKQTFVDLGCGNGLLVNILSSEGHMGIGIDVRKRKIWDLYDSGTVLIEKAVEPSDHLIFPNYDWIIGNHSDELTPWIPVIAARSSYKMRVFLLPCCCYTFNGKYERDYPGSTQYQSYLTFIRALCESMGFKVLQDKLRIPSTKRICFICMSRTYKEEEGKEVDALRTDFICCHSRKTVMPYSSFVAQSSPLVDQTLQNTEMNEALHKIPFSVNRSWIADFKPREKVEIVRNCTNLDKKFLEETVIIVVDILLKTENYLYFHNDAGTIHWNAGGQISITDLIKLIDPSILKCMKNQCGGFQTFLRNHKNVFEIKHGNVQLTVPSKDVISNIETHRKRGRHHRKKKKLIFLREKKCFFHFHHPQGCPLSESNCNFSHESD